MSKWSVERSGKIIADFKNPIKFWIFKWKMLPAAGFMGLKIRDLGADKCVTSIRYGWRNTNPFKSMYFAAQCAAGELATGALATVLGKGFEGNMMMLVKNLEAEFFKQAKGNIIFTCNEGEIMLEIMKSSIDSGESKVFKATAIGTDENGDIVSKISISWSFKYKQSV